MNAAMWEHCTSDNLFWCGYEWLLLSFHYILTHGYGD